MVHTAYNLYEDYKRAWYQAADAVEALKRNFADEVTIKKAEKLRNLNECLANFWGRLYRYNLPDTDKEFFDPYDDSHRNRQYSDDDYFGGNDYGE